VPGAAAGCRSAMQRIDGVRALVTGATSGLGRALAQALVQGGARVVVTDRDVDRTRAAADELGAVAVACDVTDEHAVNRGVAQAYSRLGGLDLLVNNAGIGMRTVNPAFMTRPQPFYEVPSAGFRAVVATNLTGYFLVARAVVPRMLAGGRRRPRPAPHGDRVRRLAGRAARLTRRSSPAARYAAQRQLGEDGPVVTAVGRLRVPSCQRQVVPATLAPFSW